jgi:hypothetical protein
MLVQGERAVADYFQGWSSKKPACLDRVQTALLAAAAKREAQPLLCTNPLHRLLGQFAVSDHEPVSVADLFAFMFSIDHR